MASASRPWRACQRQLGQVAVEQRQDRLCLGVTEAAVELEQLRAVLGEHEAGVQHADVRGALGGEVIDHGLDELRGQRVGVVPGGCRRVRAHAAGVRAGVAVEDALVVLGDRQRPSDRAVAQGDQAALGPGESLLEHDRALRGELADGGIGLGGRGRHDHALAGGQTVELHDHGQLGVAPPADGVVVVVAAMERRRRQAQLCGERTCVTLRGLEPGEVGGRAEARDTGLGTAVGGAGGKRRLGPDDDQIGGAVNGKVELGGLHDLVPVAAARPRDGGLAAAGADHDHAHQASTPSKPSFGCAWLTSMGYRPV